MGNKRGPRNIGPEKFIRTWLHGEPQELAEAFRKEASRECNEMENWMKEQVEYDPQNMLWEYEDTLIPLVKKALRYRYRIYAMNKQFKELEQKAMEICGSRYGGDPKHPGFAVDPEVVKLNDEHADVEADQMALVWRIKKIHSFVKTKVRLELAPGESDPFAEYEYDPEKS